MATIENMGFAIANKLVQLGICAGNHYANYAYDQDLQRETQFIIDDSGAFNKNKYSEIGSRITRCICKRVKAVDCMFIDTRGGTGNTFHI